MANKLEQLIKNAPWKRSGCFMRFMLVSTGELYDGMWEENGYDKCLLFGQCGDDTDTWYKITDSADSLWFRCIPGANFDIPHEYNAVRFWFDTPVEIDNDFNLSTVKGVGSMDYR